MVRLRMDEVVQATGGELLRGAAEAEIEGVSVDSRTIRPGELFICIAGQHTDGHRFAGEALRKGAGGLLISSPDACGAALTDMETTGKGAVPLVMTGDTTVALQELARYARGERSLSVVAVTGSNGKTTTKELIANILKHRYRVLKNQGNLNNLIGLPLSLLRMNRTHNAAVLEMGMNSPGEIGLLSSIARPGVGVITNVSEAHVGGLGDLNKVVEAKGELADSLSSEDTLVLNVEEASFPRLAVRAKSRLFTFGRGQGCTVRCKRIENKSPGRIAFILEMGGQTVPVELKIPGRYNAYNAAAAATVGLVMGMEPQEIKRGLEDYEGLPMRSEIIRLGRGIKVYNDCYNANPKSMEEALKTFSGLTRSCNSTVILGDMLELGDYSQRMHNELGKLAASLRGGKLLAVGRYSGEVVAGARKGGMAREKTFAVATAEEASELAQHLVGKGQWVMVKGSRGMRMEKVVERIKQMAGEN
jgi:UDP-N-acetylmuramoyl-tripeptide--D-alanyl-D-alanine ligase